MLSHIVENWGSRDKGKEERRKKNLSSLSFFLKKKGNDFPLAKKSKAV